MKVSKCNYRFRLLNATASKLYNLVLVSYKKNEKKFADEFITVIGTDSGLRDTPVQTENLSFVMADRYEIIIDFRNYDIGDNIALVDRQPGPKSIDTPLLCFEVDNDTVEDTSTLPNKLTPYRAIDSATANGDPNFVFSFGFNGINACDYLQAAAINGRVWGSNDIQAYPQYGQWQKWRLINITKATHPIHIHLLDFQIVRRLDRNGDPVCLPLYERGSWKDVFNLGPHETLEIVGKFGPHFGRYMMHCHNLGHEDCDMMTQFEVVLPMELQNAVNKLKRASASKDKEAIQKAENKLNELFVKEPTYVDILNTYERQCLESAACDPLSDPAQPIPANYTIEQPILVKCVLPKSAQI